MAAKDDPSPRLSRKVARLLGEFIRGNSLEALRAAHPELSDRDVANLQALIHEAGGFGGKPAGAGAKRRRDCAGEAYQLKITLRGSKPPIWRRVVVPADLTLAGLHDVIQVAMGWEYSHLHVFEIGGERYQGATAFGGDEFDDLDDADYCLCDVISRAKMKFKYEYDFGDGWLHDILVEKALPAIESPETMVCLAGKNRCPPEDCGGLWGYYDKLEALADPEHPEHEEIKEWMGEIDPTEFNREAVNGMLARLKR